MDDFKIGDYVSLTFIENRMIITRITQEGDLVCNWKTREAFLRPAVLPGEEPRLVKSRTGVFRKDMLVKLEE
jgi:uncharacterized protein YodC (DUF2158 family)